MEFGGKLYGGLEILAPSGEAPCSAQDVISVRTRVTSSGYVRVRTREGIVRRREEQL